MLHRSRTRQCRAGHVPQPLGVIALRIVAAKMDAARLFASQCASCHRDDRKGTPPQFPSLVDVAARRTRREITDIIRQGSGRMPGFAALGNETIADLVDFLTTGKESGAVAPHDANWLKYRNDGYTIFQDPDGYPAIAPPWGTLNAIDLNKGEIRWKIPFGEFPDLVAKGLKNTVMRRTIQPS